MSVRRTRCWAVAAGPQDVGEGAGARPEGRTPRAALEGGQRPVGDHGGCVAVVLRERVSPPRDTSTRAGRPHLMGGQRPGALPSGLRCHRRLPQSAEFSRAPRLGNLVQGSGHPARRAAPGGPSKSSPKPVRSGRLPAGACMSGSEVVLSADRPGQSQCGGGESPRPGLVTVAALSRTPAASRTEAQPPMLRQGWGQHRPTDVRHTGPRSSPCFFGNLETRRPDGNLALVTAGPCDLKVCAFVSLPTFKLSLWPRMGSPTFISYLLVNF